MILREESDEKCRCDYSMGYRGGCGSSKKSGVRVLGDGRCLHPATHVADTDAEVSSLSQAALHDVVHQHIPIATRVHLTHILTRTRIPYPHDPEDLRPGFGLYSASLSFSPSFSPLLLTPYARGRLPSRSNGVTHKHPSPIALDLTLRA